MQEILSNLIVAFRGSSRLDKRQHCNVRTLWTLMTKNSKPKHEMTTCITVKPII